MKQVSLNLIHAFRGTTVFILFSILAFSGYSQTAENRFAVPLNFTLNQYDGPGMREIYKFKETSYGFETGLKYYLNPSFNIAGNAHFFSLDGSSFNNSVQDYNASLEYKLFNGYFLKEDSKVKPFLTGGLGFLHDKSVPSDHAFTIPFGGGVRFKMTEEVDFLVQSRYKVTPKENVANYLTTSFGAVLTFGKSKDSDGDGVSDKQDQCPNVAGSAITNGCPDSDGDGIADKDDACPNIAGPLNGCPDSDGDGIADPQDTCPNAKGTLENQGCPDSDGDGILDKDDACPQVSGSQEMNGCPDSDGDGVADKDDNCPQEAGLKANDGCPAKDTDNDGVIDEKDNCPQTAGPASNNGCPEIAEEVKEVLKAALEGVQFKTGSDVLVFSSYEKLDKVVAVLKANPSYHLKISGYTDNTGNEQRNLELSQDRAHSAEKYIVDKGIPADQVEAEGYGIANPIADNATAEGRAKNRRVEFEIIFN